MGRLSVQWHPPEWFDAMAESKEDVTGQLGPVDVRLTDVRVANGRLSATVRYQAGEHLWLHTFAAAQLSESDLASELAQAGLAFDR